MRIFWVSDGIFHPTGYGITTNYICRRLAEDGHQVFNYAPGGMHQGSLEVAPNLTLLSSNFGDDRWGNKTLPELVEKFRPDVVITWLDPQGMDGYAWSEVPFYMWNPVDTWPIPQHEVGILNRARQLMVPSRWGQEVLAHQGLEAEYIPCGIDLDLYDVDLEGRKRWRAQLRPEIKDSTWLIGSVGLNTGSPDRKGYGFEFQAIKLFRERHPEIDFRVYIHTNWQGDGLSMDLVELRAEMGLEDVICFSPPHGAIPSPPLYMRDMYNAFDVLLHCGMCEGIGMPLIESQACGTPVIANACTGMTEHLGPSCYKSEPLTEMYVHTATKIAIPSVENIVAQMEAAHEQWWAERGERGWYRKLVREFALSFDQKTIYEEKWRPLVAEIPERFNFKDVGPRKLMLASGRIEREGYVHHDREILYPHHSIAWDLNDLPWKVFEDDAWDFIEFSDCLEHLRADFTAVMDELWRITAPGGYVFIHTAEAGSWQLLTDPTHVLGFSINSMDFFDPERPYGWITTYSKKQWKVCVKSRDAAGLVFVLQPRKEPAKAEEPEREEVAAG